MPSDVRTRRTTRTDDPDGRGRASLRAVSAPRGLLQSLLGGRDTRSEEELVLDTVLLVALADGTFSQAEQDAVERLIVEAPLAVTWPRVGSRADALEREAPFFTAARKALLKRRWSNEAKRRALRLAAFVGTAGSPLEHEQRGLWMSLAEGLKVPEPELQELLPPWGFGRAPGDAVRLTRSTFNDPEVPFRGALFDALATARGDALRLLMFKLSAPRDLASLRLEEAQITEVGRLLSTGDHQLRVDAVVEGDGQEWWVRCLARGEALYPQERVLWPGMVASMGPEQRLAIVRQGPLYPGDQALLDELPADKVINQQL